MLSQIAPKRSGFLNINYSGKVSELDTTLVSRSVLKGFLQAAGGGEVVNVVNAPTFAENLGLKVTETREIADTGDFTELIEVSGGCGEEAASVAGTFFRHRRRAS